MTILNAVCKMVHASLQSMAEHIWNKYHHIWNKWTETETEAELDEISRVQGMKWGVHGVHIWFSRVHQAALGTYIDPIRIQCARARPNFWSARRSALNFLVRAVAKLCRLGYMQASKGRLEI